MTNSDYDLIIHNTIDNFSHGQILKSVIHGFGLFSSKDIEKGDILSILDGQVVSWEQYYKINKNLKKLIETPYNEYFFREWNALDEETLLVRTLRTKYSFINHSRTPNLELEYYPLRIVSLCKILKNTEFTLDYRKEKLNSQYLEKHGSTYL